MGKRFSSDIKRIKTCVYLLPSTMELVKLLAEHHGSQGLAIDHAVGLLAASESFGLDAVRLPTVMAITDSDDGGACAVTADGSTGEYSADFGTSVLFGAKADYKPTTME